MATMCCGGLSEPNKPSEKTQQLCDTVKPKAEERAKRTFDVFTAVSSSTQVVSGRNHFIKVKVGDKEFVHLRVYEQLACNGGAIELTDMQLSKTLEDAIEFF